LSQHEVKSLALSEDKEPELSPDAPEDDTHTAPEEEGEENGNSDETAGLESEADVAEQAIEEPVLAEPKVEDEKLEAAEEIQEPTPVRKTKPKFTTSQPTLIPAEELEVLAKKEKPVAEAEKEDVPATQPVKTKKPFVSSRPSKGDAAEESPGVKQKKEVKLEITNPDDLEDKQLGLF